MIEFDGSFDASLAVETQSVVVFDLQRRSAGNGLDVNLTNQEGVVMQRLLTESRKRLWFSQNLAGALLHISQADPDVNDGWVRMDAIVPGNNYYKIVKEDRKMMIRQLRNVSEKFGGLLLFRNISKASEIKADRPFGVAYTSRSKYHA